jgi:aryl-alcohol dehydrogenase-like predicted oxidoreductase
MEPKLMIANQNCTSRRKFLLAAGACLAGGPGAAGAVREYRRGGMVYRSLGRTGMDVSLLSFGSHTDPKDRRPGGPNRTVLSPEGQQRRDLLIEKALDLGVNLLDVYESEGQWEPVARLVKEKRQRVLISLAHEVSPAEIARAVKLFGHVDLYRFHTAEIDGPTMETWDRLRKAKALGQIRAIGIATHTESVMAKALHELEGIDYLFFPYNFIHARADYSQFLPVAIERNIGLIAMKPLASGSIMRLDPRARPGAKPEFEELQVWQRRNKAILPAAVAELTRSLNRMPDETLCMAAMRFVYGKPFLTTANTGIFEEQLLDDNYAALARYQETAPEQRAALQAASRVARLAGPGWLPEEYRWLEEQWRA